MEHINEHRDLLTRMMDMMEQQFGKDCEIVLHDHSLEFDKTIVDIRNGHITGRKIGGSGSNLGLEILRGTSGGSDQYNYITYTNNGKILRSSSIHFHNEQGALIGAFCVNLDITESIRLENFIRSYNNFSTSPEPVNEIFANDVHQMLDELIHRALQKIGKPVSQMSREDKIEFIRYLDEKGAFIIAKSGIIVGDILEISKYTFYNYLDVARGQKGGDSASEQEGQAGE